jgi:hypothetical protein
VTRPSLREYAVVQRERYLTATRAEKGALLDEVVAVTGVHRKARSDCFGGRPRAPTGRSRAGRPRLYGPAVAAAGEVLWQATGHIGPRRLHPFVPKFLDRLTRDGELSSGGAEPGRPNVHVMDLDHPDSHAPGTDQISRGGRALYHCPRARGCSPR